MKNRSRKSGFTLTEVVVGSLISVIVLTSAVTMFIGVAAAWARGENTMSGENDTRQVVRLVGDELREAMWVSVDANGMGLTYRKPKKKVNGDFEIPVVWDGKDRRFFLDGTNLKLNDGTSTRVVARKVLSVDPFMLRNTVGESVRYNTSQGVEAAPAYRIFIPNSTGLVSEVTVTIVTGNSGGKAGESMRSRKRERVVLRNVPELIK